MNGKVFFLLAGVAVALAAPDRRPATSYGVPRVSIRNTLWSSLCFTLDYFITKHTHTHTHHEL
ncbi:hypothetical protein E2C01_059676 [Portunus trituberculatus]|uniref:Uncharacterized protein n=1 Tax=Portunus trituberculatus TaxID=210409 RepID=A0A5B7H6V0_PORTR|nr:hypothetical protein [Portunus trituberculatus]